MKQAQMNIDKMRESMDGSQKALLEEIWEHFQNTAKWLTVRELYSKHGKQKVWKILTSSPLGGGIGREESGNGVWKIFKLSLLGVLLTKNGQAFRELLLRYFEFQRDLFLKSPAQTYVQSSEIIKALDLNESEMRLLGQLLALAHLGGSESPSANWNVNAMSEADSFEKKDDLDSYVNQIAFRYYNSKEPVFEEQRNLRNSTVFVTPQIPRLVYGTEDYFTTLFRKINLSKKHSFYPDVDG
jgi:hypothetical protein